MNIQQNLRNILSFEQAEQNVNLSWSEQGGFIVCVNFSTMLTNPYLVFSSIILYGVGYNGNLLSILSKEILGKLSVYYSALSTT